MRKRRKWLVVIILAGLAALAYTPDIPVDHLRERYTYPESQFLPFEGMQVHYRQTGSGPCLLLLHGVASSLHTWQGWHRRLSDAYTVVSVDLPGFGLTGPHPQADYSEAMYMRLFDTLLSHLGQDSCLVAGNSFGGYLAWHYALARPQAVKKVVLLDAAGFDNAEKTSNIGFRLAMNPLTRPFTYYVTPRFVLQRSVANVYGDPQKVTPQLVQRYYDLILRSGNRQAFATILNRLHQQRTNPDTLRHLHQPVLIIWGAQDRIIPMDNAYKFDDILPNSTLTILPDAGHVPMEELPEKTATMSRQFFSDKLWTKTDMK